MINRQTRSIIGMYPNTPIAALMSESGLVPVHILLDFRQRKYAYCLFSLLDSIPTKAILSITLRIGDENVQPDDHLEQDSIWASNECVVTYGQQLARQVSVNFTIDPAKGTELIQAVPNSFFPGKLIPVLSTKDWPRGNRDFFRADRSDRISRMLVVRGGIESSPSYICIRIVGSGRGSAEF